MVCLVISGERPRSLSRVRLARNGGRGLRRRGNTRNAISRDGRRRNDQGGRGSSPHHRSRPPSFGGRDL